MNKFLFLFIFILGCNKITFKAPNGENENLLEDPPPTPTNLLITVLGETAIQLNWTSGGGTTSDYRIAYQVGSVAPLDCASGTLVSEDDISGNTHIVSALINNTEYSFLVCAINNNATPDVSSGVSGSGTTITVAPAPDVANLVARADSNYQVTLTWDSGGGTTADYRIAYKSGAIPPIDCSSDTVISESSISGTSNVISGLISDTSYSFIVCAINANVTPDVSSGTTTSVTTNEDPPPGPTLLSATVNSDTQITLNWTSGGGSTVDYRISYQSGAFAPLTCDDGTTIDESQIAGTSKIITGLGTGRQFTFLVCAINNNVDNHPDVSSGVSVTATTLQEAPPNPTGLSATANSTTQITLSWISGSGSTTDYRIAYKSGGTAPVDCATDTTIDESQISGTSKAITGLTTNTQYSFRVCAINSNPTPDVSSGITISGTPLVVAPPNPSGQTATANSTTQITLDWISGGGTTSDYRISYQTGATAPADCNAGIRIGDGSITGVSHAVTGLTAATQYSFRICSINSNPSPDLSSGVTVTASTLQAAPPNPTGLGATVNSAIQITLNWTSGGGTTNDYRIAYKVGGTAPVDCASDTTIDETAITGTSKIITGLSGSTQYSFRVCAINSNPTPYVSSGATVSATTNSAGSSPTDLKIDGANSDSATENAQIGLVVGILTTTDTDSGDTFTYAISSGNTGNAFIISGNHLIVQNQLDFESTNSYSLEIEVTDSFALTYEETLTINVTDESWELVSYISTESDSNNLAVSGNYAYISEYNGGMKVVDISNKAAPVVVGKYYTSDDCPDIDIVANYAYLACSFSGLLVLDVTNPFFPYLVGSYDSNVGTSVHVGGNYAYLGDQSTGIKVIDISNPFNPSLVGSVDLAGTSTEKIYYSANYAYVATVSDGLQIVDVSNPAAPTVAGTYDPSGLVRSVVVNGNYAYIASGLDGLEVIDVSNKASPVQVGVYNSAGTATDVFLSGSTVYLADAGSGIHLVNVATPTAPAHISTYNTPGSAIGIFYQSNYVYVADDGAGLEIINATTPAALTLASGPTAISNKSYGIARKGNYLYSLSFASGLTTIDISNSSSPSLVGITSLTGNGGNNVFLLGNYLYLAYTNFGVRIIDVTTGASPVLRGTCNTPGSAYGVYVSGNYAYVSDGSGGLAICDISNPNSPSVVAGGTLDTPGTGNGIAYVNPYVYIVDGSFGLRIMDVSTVTTPTNVGNVDTTGTAGDIEILGSYAYIADGSSGIQVIDISNPASPVVSATYNTSGYADDVKIVGTELFVADRQGGILILDISTPTSPTLIRSLSTEGSANYLDTDGSTLFNANHTNALLIFEN